MRCLILAFDPMYVDPKHLVGLQTWLEEQFNCKSYCISHMNHEAEPIYTVQFCDTGAFRDGYTPGRSASENKV